MNKLTYEYKKVWNKKDTNTLEYREWFIFTLIVEESTKSNINNFIDEQINNFKQDNNLPPKIMKLDKLTASSFNFSSFKDNNNFTYTDNVSGSLQKNDLTHNNYLQRELINYDYVLFKPEVIINIYYTHENTDYYLYQLDENKHSTKKQIIYHPFGFPIKYNINNLNQHMQRSNIIESKEDNSTLIIPTENFSSFINLFQKDMLTEQFNFFENPNNMIKKYLFEKLNNYGILITEEEIDNFIEK